MVFIQSFVELFMLPEFLHSMCNCTFTVWQLLINIVLFVRAISYFALFIDHQEAETQQDEFHKIPTTFRHPCFKYVNGFVLLRNQKFDSCDVGSELLCL